MQIHNIIMICYNYQFSSSATYNMNVIDIFDGEQAIRQSLKCRHDVILMRIRVSRGEVVPLRPDCHPNEDNEDKEKGEGEALIKHLIKESFR